MKNKNNYLPVIAIVLSLIFLTLGFAIGNFTAKDKECTTNPLIYSVNKLNAMNDDSFTCSCTSNTHDKFWFDEKGIYTENPLFSWELE